MELSILIPMVVGCVSILQGTLNREVSNYVGVAQATLITNVVTVVICCFFYYIARYYQNLLPEIFHTKSSLFTYKWWFIFPPIFGFIIVAGMPLAITKLGAVKTTVGLIAAQMITSVAWDYFIDGISLNMLKAGGVLFAFLSVAMIALAK